MCWVIWTHFGITATFLRSPLQEKLRTVFPESFWDGRHQHNVWEKRNPLFSGDNCRQMTEHMRGSNQLPVSFQSCSLRGQKETSRGSWYSESLWCKPLENLVVLQAEIIPDRFPGGSHGEESACNAGDPGLIHGLGRSPGEGNGNPLQVLAWRKPWTEEPVEP